MLYNVIMNDDNYVTITDENVAEINPTASSDMQQAFIDNYRQMQSENTAQIGEAAHALGSDLEAQYGGLHGPSEYMKSRYQTPQTESRLAALRTAAQLSALNQLMQNDQNRWKNRYNQAYRSAQKRARAKAAATSTGGGTPSAPSTPSEPDIVTNVLDEYTVQEDPFFKRQEQTNLYNQLMQEQAAARGMSVEEYYNYLARQNQQSSATNPVSLNGGIGAYNPDTKTFNSGLGA